MELGWRFDGSDGHQVCSMRLPDESDGALHEQAGDAAQAERPGMAFILRSVIHDE